MLTLSGMASWDMTDAFYLGVGERKWLFIYDHNYSDQCLRGQPVFVERKSNVKYLKSSGSKISKYFRPGGWDFLYQTNISFIFCGTLTAIP